MAVWLVDQIEKTFQIVMHGMLRKRVRNGKRQIERGSGNQFKDLKI